MAYQYHHHHPQNPTTNTTSCYCCCQSTSSPQPPPDPSLISAIVSQLQLHHPLPNSYVNVRPPVNPTTTINLSQPHPHSPFFVSLLQRLDALEASLHRFSLSHSHSQSSSPPSPLKDAAARTIQSHFRSFLVHRSITLRHLNHLASIKSSLSSLKSSYPSLPFHFLSHKAMDLLLQLDSIQSGNKMIRDSKRALSKEIAGFLELLDGACVKRHQLLLTRKVNTNNHNMSMVRESDNRPVHHKKASSKHNHDHHAQPKSSNEEKKLMANLRERVEKINRMSKVLEQQEQEQDVIGDPEVKGFNNVDDDIIGQIASNYRLKNGQAIKKNAQSTNTKKRVCFVEDGNMIRVYDNINGDSGSTSRLVDVIEDPTKGTHDEEDAQSDGDGEESSQSSEDVRKGTSDDVGEDYCDSRNEDFTFSTPEPAMRMGTGPDFLSQKPGLKFAE
ncbi:BAG family molecular chaperone regulator 8 chloroplastic [Bienertia sinuspersici]